MLGTELDCEPFLESFARKPQKDRLRLALTMLHFEINNQGGYSARTRVFIRKLCDALRLPWGLFRQQECLYGQILIKALMEKAQREREESSKITAWSVLKTIGKGVLATGAAVGGGLLIFFTAGAAVPVIGTVLGAVGLTSAATFITSTVGALTFTTIFGAAGGGFIGYKVANRVKGVSEFNFVKSGDSDNQGMSIVISVAGWKTGSNDFKDIWEPLDAHCYNVEQYTIGWESDVLVKLGDGLTKFLKIYSASTAASYTGSTVAGSTLATVGATALSTSLTALSTTMAIPMALLTVADLIDNPWSMAFERSKACGTLLADALLSDCYGKRPVSLIGFSLGARMIYYALLELHERKHRKENPVHVSHIVQDVYLLGSPVSGDKAQWEKIREVANGRVVNGYSANDWTLAVLFRATGLKVHVAGTTAVETTGVEDLDLGALINSHADYRTELPNVIRRLDPKF